MESLQNAAKIAQFTSDPIGALGDATNFTAAEPVVLADLEGQELDEKEKEDVKKKSLMDYAVYGAVGTSSALATFAMFVVGLTPGGVDALVYVCGASSLATAPYVVYQRKQLRDGDSMRRVQNRIRQEVNRLQEQNSVIHESIDDLTDTVDRVANVEQELRALAGIQGQSVEEFCGLLQEHEKINEKIRKNIQTQVLHQLMDEVMKADRDQDGQLDNREIMTLKYYMKSMQSVIFHEDRFDAILMKDQSMKSLMQVVRNLLDSDVPEHKRVFELKVADVASGKIKSGISKQP